LNSKDQRSYWEYKCQKRFLFTLPQKWIKLRQTKTQMISDPFYTYRRIHFTSGNAYFLLYLSVIREGRMSQRPRGREPTCCRSQFKH